MNECFLDVSDIISIDDALRSDFVWHKIVHDTNKLLYFNNPSELLNQEWLDKCNAIGVDIKTAMVFYKPIDFKGDFAHIDVVKHDPEGAVICALNWIIGGNNSQMVWYDQRTAVRNVEWDKQGIPRATFLKSQLIELQRLALTNRLTLVRTDIPHTIECGSDPRWSISLRMQYGKFKTWQNAIEFFTKLKYNIN